MIAFGIVIYLLYIS